MKKKTEAQKPEKKSRNRGPVAIAKDFTPKKQASTGPGIFSN